MGTITLDAPGVEKAEKLVMDLSLCDSAGNELIGAHQNLVIASQSARNWGAGKKAWAEYLAQVEATRAKTERLRAERLSRAAAAGSHKPA